MNKYYILIASVLMTASLSLTSCSEDDLNPESVITADQSAREENDFDRWLKANFLDPYNMEFKYRYEDNESNMGYYEVPSRIEDAVMLAHILKYCCLEAYDVTVGINFTRTYFPKLIFVTGEWRYKNNGSYVLGTAEGGKKIFLLGTNYLPTYVQSVATLNHYYLKTIHHEFTHILNQTKEYSTEFQLITQNTYVSDTWTSAPYDTGYLGRGYISAYAQQEHREDFAETMALYVTNTPEQWEAWLQEAAETDNDGISGRELIEQKLSIVREYMSKQWNIDIDALRTEILKRQLDVVEGKVDITDLTVY